MRGNVSGRRNQMAGWFVQSLAICANENLPKSKKLYQSKLKRLPNTSCQSGEIGQTQLH